VRPRSSEARLGIATVYARLARLQFETGAAALTAAAEAAQ
jgi:hypothetical protein